MWLVSSPGNGVFALPVTSESKEVVLLPGFVLGWTIQNVTDVKFTLRLESPTKTWLAIGTSKGTGVGTPLMLVDSAAVVGKSVSLNTDFEVTEYEILSKSPDGFLKWQQAGPRPN